MFVYRCQLMQHLLHEDTYLKQPWQAAIQWLHYEMERVSCDGVSTTRISVILYFVVVFKLIIWL